MRLWWDEHWTGFWWKLPARVIEPPPPACCVTCVGNRSTGMLICFDIMMLKPNNNMIDKNKDHFICILPPPTCQSYNNIVTVYRTDFGESLHFRVSCANYEVTHVIALTIHRNRPTQHRTPVKFRTIANSDLAQIRRSMVNTERCLVHERTAVLLLYFVVKFMNCCTFRELKDI